jgi:tRNA nucleotidyltransferase (CCA-adding enzyme)
MARRGHVYPQVEPGAAALVNVPFVAVEPDASVASAFDVARRHDVGALVTSSNRAVLRADLARARDLGLAHLAARTLARPVPVVAAYASEVAVRRHLARGAPAVLVRDGAHVLGVVLRTAVAGSAPPPSMTHRLGRLPATVRDVVRTVEHVAACEGVRAWLVGGVVRDLLRDEPFARMDIDIVVEGDGLALADRLAPELGGRLTVHARFLTASIDTEALGTIDVITARSERYESPGALPTVQPADIDRDLGRRDVTVNAMALALGHDAGLLDPFGGRADLRARRLRALHPLAFVEDPTRIFRAARYAARLGFAMEPWTRQCRRLALDLAPYPALSGSRLVAEVEAIMADERPDAALRELGDAGVYRLFDTAYRFTDRTRGTLAALVPSLRWASDRGLGLRPVEAAITALLGDQRVEVVRGALDRLGITGEPREGIEQALAIGATTAATLGSVRTSSERGRVLRPLAPLALTWLWITGGADVRTSLDWWTATGRAVTSTLRGDDLLGLGVPRGPEVSRVLDALRDARLDATLDSTEAEVDWVRRWLVCRKEG